MARGLRTNERSLRGRSTETIQDLLNRTFCLPGNSPWATVKLTQMGISPFSGRNIFLVWLNHPRWAFVFHLVFCLIAVAILIDLIGRRDWFGAAGMGVVLVMSVGLLVVLTRWARRRGWRRFTAQEAADNAREAAYKERGLIPPS